MRSAAAVEVRQRNGRSVISDLRSEPPVSLRETAAGVAVVGSAAGPVGGDVLTFSVDVGADASLHIAGVAASMVWPGSSGVPSRQVVEIRVGRGGHLDWVGQPLLVVQNARHLQEITIELEPEATLDFCDEVALGRTGEPPGRLETRLRVVRAGVPLLDQCQIYDPASPGWSTSAGAGGFRHVRHRLVVGPTAEAVATSVQPDRAFARMPLDVDAELSISLGADGVAAHRPD